MFAATISVWATFSAIAEEMTNSTDGAIMVKVPAGLFTMGQRGGYSDESEHTVYLSEFWIYKYEVTNKQWLDFITACTNYSYRASLDLYGLNGSNQPVVAVNWEDAKAYCEWAGVTLPTEAQWEYAAKGPYTNVWPWGDTFDTNRVAWAFGMEFPGTQNVGSYTNGTNWCGVFDMAGNAWEWCADDYSYSYPSGTTNPVCQQPSTYPARKHLRGGGWGSVGGWLGTGGYELRGSFRYGAAFPAHRSIYNGFRCVSGSASNISLYTDTRSDPEKSAPSYYTTQELERVRANIAAYPSLADRLPIEGTAAVSYLPTSVSNSAAWGRPTGQDVPRAYKWPSWPMCPECGQASEQDFGLVYGPVGDARYDEWKVKCPNCGEEFPKNDFKAYYDSGLDTAGTFRAYLADRSLLYNEDYPNPTNSLHYYQVDDGSGWVDENGQRHYWVGWFNYSRMNHFGGALKGYMKESLKSDNATYMRRLAFLLYRMAKLYPEYDLRESWKLGMRHSSGASGDGRIAGRIWENDSGLNCFGYDAVFDFIGSDTNLLAILQEQLPDEEEPGSASDIRKYIEKYYIAEILDAYFGSWPGIKANTGSNVRGLVTTAITLDDPARTTNALETLFAAGWLGSIFESYIDRDGAGYEGAPGYTFGWTEALHDTAQLLKRSKYSEDYGLYSRYPLVWEQMYLTPYYITALDKFTPRVEDHGTCGLSGMTSVNRDMYLDAFELMTNCAARSQYAQIAYVAAGGNYSAMFGSVVSDDPTAIRDDVEDVINAEGEINLPSTVRDGYGMAMLRSGTGDDRRAAFLYFGRQAHAGHGQHDSLNMGLYYNGINVAPDLGYPEYTVGDDKSDEWIRNTIAHNLVTVDRTRQSGLWIGRCHALRQESGLALVEVDSAPVYSAASVYRRTLAMVDIDDEDSYYVDVFRVRGGDEHVYGFHGADGTLAVTGVNLVEQEGTYLGTNISYGGSSSLSGYQWLEDVSASTNGTGEFLAEWTLSDYYGHSNHAGQVYLRLTMLTECDDIAIATGHPAWSYPENETNGYYRPLRYLLARRYPGNEQSDFITVLEPALESSKLSDIDCLSNTNGICAVQVVTTSGRTDTFVCTTGTSCQVASGDIEVHGRWGFVSESSEKEYTLFLMGGDYIQLGEVSISLDAATITGSVVDRGNATNQTSEGWFTTSTTLTTNGALTGHQVWFDSSTTYDWDGPRDTLFEIQGVTTNVGGYTRVDLGSFRMTSGYIDSGDPEEGMKYLFNSTDSFEIPMSARLQRSGETWELDATCDVLLELDSWIGTVEYQLSGGSWEIADKDGDAFVIPCGTTSGAVTFRQKRMGPVFTFR